MRGGWVAGSNPFTVMTNIFVPEFVEFSEQIYEKLPCFISNKSAFLVKM